jgi:hypothetical protein
MEEQKNIKNRQEFGRTPNYKEKKNHPLVMVTTHLPPTNPLLVTFLTQIPIQTAKISSKLDTRLTVSSMQIDHQLSVSVDPIEDSLDQKTQPNRVVFQGHVMS